MQVQLPVVEARAGDPSAWDVLFARKDECMRQLSCLSEEHRAVLLLYFLEESFIEEIASITGTHTGTVKSRMHFAKRALRKPVEGKAP